MKKNAAFLLLMVISFLSSAQQISFSEEAFRNYLNTNKDSLNPIEGIWNVNTTQEFYHSDTLFDVVKFPEDQKIAVGKKENKFFTITLKGAPFNVEFIQTDVKGVYLYRNYFPEIQDTSKVQAVINRHGEMEYTYDFPEDALKIKLGKEYKVNTRIVNILKWTQTYPSK